MSKKVINVLFSLLSLSLLVSCGNDGSGEEEKKHEHNYGNLYAEVEPTCEEDGHKSYYYCAECGTFFSPEKVETTYEEIVIKALGHDWKPVEGEESTCDTHGYKNYYDCSRCDKFAEDGNGKNQFSDLAAWKESAGKLDTLGHDLDHIDGLDPTCSSDGYKDCYFCSKCEKYYEDELATTLISDITIWRNTVGLGKLPAGHRMTHYEEKAPTGLYEGNEEYYECQLCHNFYSDESGNNKIEENSWKLASLKAITFDLSTKLAVKDAPNYEYLAKSKEGDGILFEIPNFEAPEGTFVKVASGKYCHIKTPLNGVKNIKITGTGEVFIYTGLAGWTWDNEYVASANLSTNPLTITFDQNKVNNIQFYSRSGFSITGLEINIEGKLTEGYETDSDLTEQMFAYTGTRWDGQYGTNCGLQSQITNNSNSAFRVSVQTVDGGDPWIVSCLAFKKPLDLSKSKGLQFDVHLVSGSSWASIKLFNEQSSEFCSLDWDGESVVEMGFNTSGPGWKTIKVKPLEDFKATHVLFTLHPVKTEAGESWNEIIIDNMNYLERPFVQLETNLQEWTWRRVPSFAVLEESEYLGKSIAIDFKTIENGQFEITYMSDEQHYIGEFNTITVTSMGVIARYGTIKSLGDDWYTLVVDETLLNHPSRSSYSSTIGTIYVYRDIGPVCSFILDYGSLRVI